MTETQRRHHRSEIVWGAALILAGVLFLLFNFDVLESDAVWRYWPLVFVAIGVLKMTAVRSVKEIGPPMWWIFIGAWLYVSVFEIYGLSFARSWPILIIAWGVSTLWNAFTRKPGHIWN